MINWWLSQWTPSQMNNGTWYNVPIMILGTILVVGILISMGFGVFSHSKEDSQEASRICLLFIFVGIPALIIWPLVIPLALVCGFVYVAWRAW